MYPHSGRLGKCGSKTKLETQNPALRDDYGQPGSTLCQSPPLGVRRQSTCSCGYVHSQNYPKRAFRAWFQPRRVGRSYTAQQELCSRTHTAPSCICRTNNVIAAASLRSPRIVLSLCRYMQTDELTDSIRTSPGSKVATLSKQSLSLTSNVRTLVEDRSRYHEVDHQAAYWDVHESYIAPSQHYSYVA